MINMLQMLAIHCTQFSILPEPFQEATKNVFIYLFTYVKIDCKKTMRKEKKKPNEKTNPTLKKSEFR